MKLGLMPGDVMPAAEMRAFGFEALQMFFGWNRQDDAGDPGPEDIAAALKPGNLPLAAMTIHIDLVGPTGAIGPEENRAVRCVAKTAALKDQFDGDGKPILIWHPSEYPDSKPGVDDNAVFRGLCSALGKMCAAAEKQNVNVAVEITRSGSVGSAEAFLRIKDMVASPALKVCLDAANFVPDRTPLERAVRMLAKDVVIAHAKDSRFAENGEVAAYGATGTGKLDYAKYMRCLRDYCPVPYMILEYFKNRDELLRARDIILTHM